MASSQRKMRVKSGLSEKVKSFVFCSKKSMERQMRADMTAEQRAKQHRQGDQSGKNLAERLTDDSPQKIHNQQGEGSLLMRAKEVRSKKNQPVDKTESSKMIKDLLNEMDSESGDEDAPNKDLDWLASTPPAKDSTPLDIDNLDDIEDDAEAAGAELEFLKREESGKSKTNSGGRLSEGKNSESRRILKAEPHKNEDKILERLQADADDENPTNRPPAVSDEDMALLKELVANDDGDI